MPLQGCIKCPHCLTNRFVGIASPLFRAQILGWLQKHLWRRTHSKILLWMRCRKIFLHWAYWLENAKQEVWKCYTSLQWHQILLSCFSLISPASVSSLVAHLVLIKVERWALSPFPSLFLSFSLNSPPRLPPPSKYLMPRYIYRELEPTLSLCPTLVALIKIGDGRTQLCPVIHDETLANEVRFVSPDCPYMRTSWCKDCLIRLRLSYSIK